jgi:hypothetical protein
MAGMDGGMDNSEDDDSNIGSNYQRQPATRKRSGEGDIGNEEGSTSRSAKRTALNRSSLKGDAETNDERDEGRMIPPANDDAFQQELASIAFAPSYFYHVDSPDESEQEQWTSAVKKAAFFQEYRESAFRGLTVREVFQQPAEVWQRQFKSAGIDFEKVTPYDLSGTSIEDILVKRRIVPLSDVEEVKRFEEMYVPLVAERYLSDGQTVSNATYSRMKKVCFVLGSSGSGKTFFALQHAADILDLAEGTKRTTLYFQPISAIAATPNIGDAMLAEDAGETYLDPLMTWIKAKIATACRMPLTTKLNMHLSVIVDEAGAPELNGFFEDRENIDNFIEQLGHLADSVFLVLCGTGVTGAMYSSKTECPKYRMRPWPSDDLESVLVKVCTLKRPTTGRVLFSRKHVEDVVAAIGKQLTLNALSTNARCATFLLEAIWYLSVAAPLPDSKKAWLVRLSGLTQDILSRVIVQYKHANGLSLLKTDGQLRRVAASVFHAVAAAQANPTVADLPEFYGLFGDSELACAWSLIENNVEERVRADSTFADPTFPSAVLVTPAIVLILCSMLGVPAQILSNFKAQELVAALHAFGKMAVREVATFGDSNSTESQEARKVTLEESLKALTVYRLTKRVPITRHDARIVRVPIVGKTAVCLNGDAAPGPDVFTENEFYQCKASEARDKVYVNPGDEMGKCGLLQTSDAKTKKALDGFHAVWNGDVAASQDADQNAVDEEAITDTTSSPTPLSMAYPFHMLDTPSAQADVEYLEYDTSAGKWSKDLPPTQPLSSIRKIAYILSTNAKHIQFTGTIDGVLNWKDFLFARDDLDGNGCIDQAKWTPQVALPGEPVHPGKPKLLDQWKKFLSRIDTDVAKPEPRFLFT